jgi:hypothetical protein
MIISKDQKPPVGGMGGSLHSWERGLDCWHQDAFKGCGKDIEDAIATLPESGGKRKEGWNGLDWCGNVICFVPDGTEITDA